MMFRIRSSGTIKIVKAAFNCRGIDIRHDRRHPPREVVLAEFEVSAGESACYHTFKFCDGDRRGRRNTE